jgi:hypothetical protein
MRVTGSMGSAARGKLPLPQASARIVEKTSAISTLKHGPPDAPPPRHKDTPRLQVELVCQDGTDGFDPFRDAPKLRPAFVAQLLGQVMAPGHVRPSAHSAYRRCGGATLRRIDRLS